MRHKVAGNKLGRPTALRMAMLRNMVTDFLRNESIQTTDARAREVRRLAEKVITRGKKGSLHQRRLAAAFLTDEAVVKKVFEDLGPRYKERPGGYTRLIKLNQRKGDAASMALVELV